MWREKIEEGLKEVVLDLGFIPTDIFCSIPENSKFGDYTTNIALQLSKQKKPENYQSPQDIASKIVEKLGHPGYLEQIEVAGAGFINFFLKDKALSELLSNEQTKTKNPSPKRIIVEYADLNTHKIVHIGHLRTLIIGESIARLLEYQGHEVFRINYGSDIGLTIGKSLWGINNLQDKFESVKDRSLREKVEFLGEAYAFAHGKYESSPQAKEAIVELTKKVYMRDLALIPLWEQTKQWSLAYFDTLYSKFDTEFDLRVNESEVDQRGKDEVLRNVGKVFIEDQGAVIFPGEKYGLHNRVFITRTGHPTYEAKEVGLIEKYQEVYPFDEAIILSDIQQAGFFGVVNKAIELLNPHLEGRKKYLGYGFVGLKTGRMSSREGNVISVEELIDLVVKTLHERFPGVKDWDRLEKIAIAAIKLTYLKYALSSDMSFDIETSTSLEGDSGPYLLYTVSRINSLTNRAKEFEATGKLSKVKSEKIAQFSLEIEEREVLRLLEYFGAVADQAASELRPSHLCTYLLSVAKAYNLFYEKHPVLGSSQQFLRLALSYKVGETLKKGLFLLGIKPVERM